MKFQGDCAIKCKSCGAVLYNTFCEYCGNESDYIFMYQKEIENLLYAHSSPRIMNTDNLFNGNDIYYHSPAHYYKRKAVVLRI